MLILRNYFLFLTEFLGSFFLPKILNCLYWLAVLTTFTGANDFR